MPNTFMVSLVKGSGLTMVATTPKTIVTWLEILQLT